MGTQRHAPAALSAEERPGTHYTGGRLDLEAGLDGCRKSRPHRDSIPGPSSPYRVATPTELWRPTYVFVNLYYYTFMFVCLSLCMATHRSIYRRACNDTGKYKLKHTPPTIRTHDLCVPEVETRTVLMFTRQDISQSPN